MKTYEVGLVSIITPNYNCEKYIVETIESVIHQTYKNWEMIIVDDCSTDKSYSIALEYSQKDSRIKVINNYKNIGTSLSRNRAIEIAKGEYIAFLDSDDVWLEKKLEIQVNYMKQNKCDFSFMKYSLMNENSVSLNIEAKVIKRLNYRKFLFHCYTGCLTVCYNIESIGKVYGPNILNNNDYGLFLDIVKKSNNAMGINASLARYRIRENSLSRNKIYKIKPFLILMVKYNNLNYFVSFFYLITNYVIKKIWKFKKINKSN